MKILIASNWNVETFSLYFNSPESRSESLEFSAISNANWETACRYLHDVGKKPDILFLIFHASSILGNPADVADSELLIDRFRQNLLSLSEIYDEVFFEFIEHNDSDLLSTPSPLLISDVLPLTSKLNLEVSKLAQSTRNIHQTHLINAVGVPSLKNYVRTKCPYSVNQIFLIGRRILKTLDFITSVPSKVVVCDLDNTLWGGIIGDQDFNDIKIGGHDPLGELHQIIQSKLLQIKRKGIVLVAVSKNDERTVENFFKYRTDMPLKISDFSSFRFNFQPKALNIIEIANELNILVKDFIVFDDNIGELIAIKDHIPEIGIIEHEATPYSMYQSLMNDVRLWPRPSTDEDKIRSAFYAQESERKKIINSKDRKRNTNLNLEALELKGQLAFNQECDFDRVVQLLNKTNQFNFTTRRFNVSDYRVWLEKNSIDILTLRAADRFGDYGLIGFIAFKRENKKLELFDFVFSCRAMLRGLEEMLFQGFIQSVALENIGIVKVAFKRTEKNDLAFQFCQKYQVSGILDQKAIKVINEKLETLTAHISKEIK